MVTLPGRAALMKNARFPVRGLCYTAQHVRRYATIPEDDKELPRALACQAIDILPKYADESSSSEPVLWEPGSAGMLSGSR